MAWVFRQQLVYFKVLDLTAHIAYLFLVVVASTGDLPVDGDFDGVCEFSLASLGHGHTGLLREVSVVENTRFLRELLHDLEFVDRLSDITVVVVVMVTETVEGLVEGAGGSFDSIIDEGVRSDIGCYLSVFFSL